MAEHSVNYEALEQDRFKQSRENLKERLRQVSEGEMGRHGGLRRTILGYVVGEKYDQAKTDLASYVDKKTLIYPNFGPRVEKFLKHALELVHAIQTKRNFPGLGSLSLSKQQELNERVLAHFDELKQTLKTIERAEKEIKLSDHRSTAWVVTVFMHSVLILFMVAFVNSIVKNGLYYSAMVVFDSLMNDITFELVRMLHWG
jgi:hypothetical protein